MSDQENLRKCARMVNVPWPRCVHICTGKKKNKKMKSLGWLDRTAKRVAKKLANIDPDAVLANFA